MKKLLTIFALIFLSSCYVSEYATDSVYYDRNYYEFRPYYYDFFYYRPINPYYYIPQPRYIPRYQQPRIYNLKPQPKTNYPKQAPIRKFAPKRNN